MAVPPDITANLPTHGPHHTDHHIFPIVFFVVFFVLACLVYFINHVANWRDRFADKHAGACDSFHMCVCRQRSCACCELQAGVDRSAYITLGVG
jgi:hypothetical protein